MHRSSSYKLRRMKHFFIQVASRMHSIVITHLHFVRESDAVHTEVSELKESEYHANSLCPVSLSLIGALDKQLFELKVMS